MVRLNIPLDPGKTGQEAMSLENNLRRMIVGQDEAIQQIVNIYQMYLTGMSAPGRPIGNFLFLGPTGSGKTRIVEATAEALLKNPRAVIKIDCAEFQHSHEIAKLIGSPPGYLGHRETHPLLSQEVLNQYHTDNIKLSFVLFDEIEKASDALWNLLLGILDKATLTLGDNRKVDFSRAMIFMTSNLGATEMGAMMTPKLGFGAGAARAKMATGEVDEGMSEKARAHRRRSRAPQVHAGVHQSPGQDRDLPAARERAVKKGAGHRIEFGSATDLQHLGRPCVCLHCSPKQAKITCSNKEPTSSTAHAI